MHTRGAQRPRRDREGREVDEMHTSDAAVMALAAGQHGIVTTAQLAAVGLGPRAIAHRVAHGRLVRVYRGVFQVGPLAAQHGHEMAAVLATGGVLSHHSAAKLWDIRPHHDGDVHITVIGEAPRARPGLRVHRPTPSMPPLNKACPSPLPPEPWSTSRRTSTSTSSTALPRPEANAMVGRYEVDMLWRRQRLIVEVDGYAFHSGRAAFERDRRRDAALQAAGYRVVRFTWRQITLEPHAVVARLATLLNAPQPS